MGWITKLMMSENGEGLYPTNRRGTHIAHLNLQSINNKFDLVKIQVKKFGFHIFSFSESWLTESVPDVLVSIEGYNILRWDRSWRDENQMGIKKGGGTGFYIRDDITFSQDGLTGYNCSSKDIECCWLQIINSNAKDMLLCVVYRPPTGNVGNFCDTLSSTMEEIGNNTNKEIFILGDFNINYLDKNDVNTKILLQMELNIGLRQVINEPTRGRNIIDLIYTNSHDVASSGVVDFNVSDHDLIFISKKKKTVTRKQVSFMGRSYRNYNKELFQNNIKEANWDGFWLMQDPNECWDYIYKLVSTELDKMCPCCLLCSWG